MQVQFSLGQEYARVWRVVRRRAAQLTKHEQRLAKKPAFKECQPAAIVLVKGKRMELVFSRDHQSSYDMDDSVDMHLFAQLRTDKFCVGTFGGGGKPSQQHFAKGPGFKAAGIVTCEKWGVTNSYQFRPFEMEFANEKIAWRAHALLHKRLTGKTMKLRKLRTMRTSARTRRNRVSR
jgi:hypothetical protein